MPRKSLGVDVFQAALDRLTQLYEGGDRVVVQFSAGKDSTVTLELAIIAATLTDRLPVDVVLRDEEIMYPGTYEYAERVMERPEVRFRWLCAFQPMVNAFNRQSPYWWLFDDRLDPDEWVRPLPPYAERLAAQHIQGICTTELFPPPDGKRLVGAMGLRVQESRMRAMGIASTLGHMTTKPNQFGAWYTRPIYDWRDGDVWRAIRDNAWDYNRAYDAMHRAGVPAARLRTGPPTINAHSLDQLGVAAKVWPRWFDRVSHRCPGVRTAVQFGARVMKPDRQLHETWQECFERECLGPTAPEWIRDRAYEAMTKITTRHPLHSSAPFPEAKDCMDCGTNGSWKSLANNLYLGDPFAIRTGSLLKAVEPEFFREGAGVWGGNPSF